MILSWQKDVEWEYRVAPQRAERSYGAHKGVHRGLTRQDSLASELSEVRVSHVVRRDLSE